MITRDGSSNRLARSRTWQRRISWDMAVAATDDDGGKHDGGPMPPEAPRDPAPSGGSGK
ncbi:hypothetical protein [Streptomyces sp. IB2014 016-6]|uniref:hypothetical protein n=1 Tax=Streptomyces sp. IB2014 016-6 TaxID=2517818 RepID=UPI00164FFFF2|nr:hypothetical protein [Streptomyces sp. IB2014 016-6]